MVQWLRCHGLNAEGMGSIPGEGTKIPHAMWCGQRIKNFFKISFYWSLVDLQCCISFR